MNSFINNELSEGEIFLVQFFKEEDIKFKSEVKIEQLQGDEKQYRNADFYLPKYKIYVEFFGQYNVSPEHKTRYQIKKNIYEANKIPCVYLYPENLGIIGHIFSLRMKKELAKYNMDKELFSFRLHEIFADRGETLVYIALAILFAFVPDYSKPFRDVIPIVLIYVSVIFYQLYRIYMGYQKFFKN